VAQGLVQVDGNGNDNDTDTDDGNNRKNNRGRNNSRVLKADDPRLTKTYAEFPLSSFDILMDDAIQYLPSPLRRRRHDNYNSDDSGQQQQQQQNTNNKSKDEDNHETVVEDDQDVLTMVDIGSGLGRIVLYTSLTRGGVGGGLEGVDDLDVVPQLHDETTATIIPYNCSWDIHGIEIASLLHDGAVRLAQTGVEDGIFVLDEVEVTTTTTTDDDANEYGNNNTTTTNNNNNDIQQSQSGNKIKNDNNRLSFHLGSAAEFGWTILSHADIVFAYSTAFTAKEFSPQIGALLLDDVEWSEMLYSYCPDGCIVVTTDRALNPKYGWELLNRISVDNPDVWGSIGYIHRLNKPTNTKRGPQQQQEDEAR
jgi:hypothetical protein